MDKEDFTSGAKLRLWVALIVFLLSILILLPAPTYGLWKLEIAVTEWSPYLAICVLLVVLTGWVYGRYRIHATVIAAVAFCITAIPLVRGFQVAEDLPARLVSAFGDAAPRSVPGAPALSKPITLRKLYEGDDPIDVRQTTSIYTSRASGFLKFDFYTSNAFNSPRPAVIVVHGGSWAGGDREDLPGLNYYLASRGYAVAAISYRLAPEFPNPAQSEDLNSAIAFIKANAAPLNVDPTRIALLGRSAGGHLVLLSAYTNGDPAIRGVIALYAPTDQVHNYQNPSRVIASRQILRNYLSGTPFSNPMAYVGNSPIRHVSAQSPPTLLIHGSKDELVSVKQSRMLEGRLKALGRPHMLLELPWATHGCDYVFNGPCGQISTFAIERFLAAVLR